MVNPLYNEYDYKIPPKRLEQFQKYNEIIQWGRQNPTRFAELVFGIQFTDHQKWMILSSWVPSTVVWLCSRATGKSFMASVFLMLRSLLFANNNCYIMAPSGNQSQETFTKMEDIAKKNIASLTGTTDVFFNECMRMNSIADPFTHSKQGFTVSLYNGSTVNSLNSVAKNIVGIRSNVSFFDEAGKIDRDYYALTLPFTVQSADFITGTGINSEIYPKQLPNKNVFLSSAEGIDSYLFEMYKLCYNKMLLGDPDYFVCDIDCNFSLHPLMNGKPYMAQLKQSQIDDAMKTNPYRATREYYNIFDSDGGEDVFVKRSVILKNSYSYFPEYFNDGTKKYIIAYDPSSKLDNSIVGIAELFRDEEKGLMLKMVNCENLIELLPNGEKAIIQKPQQIELIKKMLLDYNRGALDYENIDLFIIDAGAGGKICCREIGRPILSTYLIAGIT